MDYMQKIEELKSKIAAEEFGEVEAKSVDLTQWGKIGNELAEQFEDYSTKVKRLETRKQLDDLKHEARQKVENFNNFVLDLEQQTIYTENAKIMLYKEKRRSVESELKNIGHKQLELMNSDVDFTQDSAKKAYKELKDGATVADLKPQDFSYITLILSRDSSYEARKKIAEKYNYHFAVLDVLNTGLSDTSLDGQPKTVKHPLEYMQNGMPRCIAGLFDVVLPSGSFYNREILKDLNNKLFHGETGKSAGALF